MIGTYGSHLPILVALARRREIRHVIEYGGGSYSTAAFLRLRLFPHLIDLTTYEDNPVWAEKLLKLRGDRRWVLVPVERGTMFRHADDVADLVLVDNDPYEERVALLRSLYVRRPTLVVLHDVESYYYDEAVALWPHVARYSPMPGAPDTALLTFDARIDLDAREIEEAIRILEGEVFE